MSSIVKQLTEKELIRPPTFLPDNIHYEAVVGSIAYGASIDVSDFDLYGFCVPPKHIVFPHLSGEIFGFGRKQQRFDQYQQHHILDKTALNNKGRNYDITIYNIVRYFQLCMDNNPNMLDSLFVPRECILHITPVGELVRENRKLFLHKGSYHKFKGYAFSQSVKMVSQNRIGKRAEKVAKWGFDLKFASHLIRLCDECEQILTLGDLDLRRSAEHQKAIRRGEKSLKEIQEWFASKEKTLEKMYQESKLRYGPDEPAIKSLLLKCLEQAYGSIDKLITEDKKFEYAIYQIEQIIRNIIIKGD